jgi:hypothetical protein
MRPSLTSKDADSSLTCSEKAQREELNPTVSRLAGYISKDRSLRRLCHSTVGTEGSDFFHRGAQELRILLNNSCARRRYHDNQITLGLST